MKHLIAAVVLSFLLGCGNSASPPPTPSPNLQGTVDAQVKQLALQTTVAQTQTAIPATQTALALAQTAAVQAQAIAQATQTGIAAAAAAPPPTITLAPSPLPTRTLPAIGPSTATAAHTNTAPPVIVVKTQAPPTCTVPFYVYGDWGAKQNHFVPEGFMGDYADIKLDDNFQRDAERPDVIKITYTPGGPNRFGGIYWWDPPGSSFGALDGGFNLSCAKKLTFLARGDSGGETAEFKVGGLDGKFGDSLRPAKSTGPIVLTNQWVKYELDLQQADLSHTLGGFVWVTNAALNPNGATIYLDEIRFE